ncbi:hypothetical protein DSCO28_70010 [Desulfosarcina ovata subsp. sediminis]|uniref:Uncharacterized protein n=1 Tax=Desulfosarcina ovata subsp. sediminis TaxID=885957 RepID=A0A5K7ZT02_9BACT|nr:hypothetical protein DSCO28_01910 [Desulfosarcina ovata subsp. sediminis]BBO79759.1 hypothetical protein DSCO28_03250 [Desulfosarcina ovata subsp. sediminis]BBO80443.1 hypothetical protein DSCO28_10090 [Desulfosarcina ovata subsp. sediminis]BBO80855.1 hypothetical protein DSCO28_14210 [Desulfosarcina ovata subsp. sediminis]BBO80907.1 hypothetical protein DSCO28_14730 [Desulfosarcina ovata subsp. sediminis]
MRVPQLRCGPEADCGAGLGQTLKKRGCWHYCIENAADSLSQTKIAGLMLNPCRAVMKSLTTDRENLSNLIT